MELRNQNAVMHFHTSEQMAEVTDGSAKLMLCSCTHLGGWQTWDDYVALVERVAITEGLRKLRPDGYVVAFQTDAFVEGKVMPRGPMLLDLFMRHDYRLLDMKIWRRLRANFRQPPWSHVYVMAPPGGSARRPANSLRDYFQGIWEFPQVKAGKLNSWPADLCRLLVESFTEPGDLVLDPFAGSGRLLGVASGLGRLGVGYEIDMDLVPVIEQNIGMAL